MTTPDQDTTAQRSATRAPVGKPIKLQFDDSMDVVEGLCENISIGGMFIQVAHTRPQGSLVRFELQLDDSTAVRGLGEVVWMRAKSAGAGRSAGIGIKFRFLEQRDRQLIFKLVSQHIKERLASRQGQGGPGGRAPDAPATPPAALTPPPPAAAPPPVVPSEVPAELLAAAGKTVASGGPGKPKVPDPAPPEPAFPEPALPEPSFPELEIPEPTLPQLEIPGPAVPGSLIREPEEAVAEVLEPVVDDSEVPELLLVPEEEEPEVELVEDFDTELEGLEAAPALVESIPDLPRSDSGDDATLSELTLTPGVEEEISFDEMMGREPTGAHAQVGETPGLGVPDVATWAPGLSEPGAQGPGETDAGMPDHGGWETIGEAGTGFSGEAGTGFSGEAGPEEPAGEGLTEEEFGPSRRRSPLLLALVAVLVAAAAAVYFFRDDLFGGRPAPPVAGLAPEVVIPEEGVAAGTPAAGTPSPVVAEAAEPSPDSAADAPPPSADWPATGTPAAGPPAAAPPPSAPPVAAPPTAAPPPAPASTAAPLTRVTDISWSALAGGGQRVVIVGDGSVPQGRYRYSRLSSPPRELIRLSGVVQPFAKTALQVGGPAVDRIRFGYHPGNELHIVLDLADPRARIREVRSVASGLEVDLEIQ